MSSSYPLQQLSNTGTVVKVPGGEVDPSDVARQLMPISDAMGRVLDADRAGYLQAIEVALSITANGDIAFMKSGGEAAALKLTFSRRTDAVRI
ncbi:MAG: Pepco domain-containing protein [Actinomycetota bacterium]